MGSNQTWKQAPVVHVYGQWGWHDHAGIVGNTYGLLRILRAVLWALIRGHAVAEVIVNDGEGYELVIFRHGKVFQLAVPYEEGLAREANVRQLRPYPDGTVFGSGPLLHAPTQLPPQEQ